MAKTVRALILSAVVLCGFVVWTFAGWSGDGFLSAIHDVALLVFVVPGLALTLAAAAAARGRPRAGWISMAVALAGWGFSLALRIFDDVNHDVVSFPSVADAAYMLFPICACVALVLLAGERSDRSAIRILLDGLIVIGSLLIVSWITILSPIQRAGTRNGLELVASLAYPVTDVVMLTVAALVLVRALSDRRLALTLLATGIASIALADSASVFLSRGSVPPSSNAIEIGWIAGLLLISVAGVAAREAAHHVLGGDQVPGWPSLWLPYFVLAVAAIVAVSQFRVIHSEPIVIIAGLTAAAVVVRQLLTVADNRRLQAVVAEQALHDPLTHLGNRALFNDRLWHAMQLHERGDLSVAVILLDLDDFKLVNDTLGHASGDALLRRSADRITQSVRPGDTVFRVGGDEFAVLLQDSSDYSQSVAHRVAVAFDKPFDIAGEELMIHPSVSLAVAGANESATSAEELLRRADVAMESAKTKRIGGVYTFTPEMELDGGADHGRREAHRMSLALGEDPAVRLLGELRGAIDKFELALYYQPKINLRTGEIVGVEALVRWPHPQRGVLGPQHFLHLVRRHGMMWPLTELVVRKAVDDAARWHAESIDVPVAVNLFAPLLGDLTLPTRIAAGLADRGLSTKALTVELTEDLLIGDLARTREVMNQLRQNGIRIAIDDFGQAYSAFSYLRDLPVDEVKLDHSFIASIVSDSRSAVVAQSVLGMATKLGLTTVAEGVENTETAEMLRQFGCDYAQGFLFSPPLTPDDMVALLKAGRAGFANPTPA